MITNGRLTFEDVTTESFNEVHRSALVSIAGMAHLGRNLYTLYGEIVDKKLRLWYAYGDRTSCHVLFAPEESLWVLAVHGRGFFSNLQFFGRAALQIAAAHGCSDVRATVWDKRAEAAYKRLGAVLLYSVWGFKDGR